MADSWTIHLGEFGRGPQNSIKVGDKDVTRALCVRRIEISVDADDMTRAVIYAGAPASVIAEIAAGGATIIAEDERNAGALEALKEAREQIEARRGPLSDADAREACARAYLDDVLGDLDELVADRLGRQDMNKRASEG